MSEQILLTYRTAKSAHKLLGNLLLRAERVLDARGQGTDEECQLLDAVVEGALALAIHVSEVMDPDPYQRLRAKVAVASRAADIALMGIHTPMDAPLAHVCSAAALLEMALDQLHTGEP